MNAENDAPLRERNATRNRRAHAFSRRRLGNSLALALVTGLCWALVSAIIGAALPYFPSFHRVYIPWTVLFILFIAMSLATKLLPGWGLGAVAELRYTVQLTGLLMGAVILIVAMTSGDVGQILTTMLGFVLLVPLLLLGRSLVKGLLIRWRVWGVPVVIYGAGHSGRKIIAALLAEPGLGYVPLAAYDDNPALHGQTLDGVPVVGSTGEWTYNSPVAILAMPGAGRQRYVDLLDGPLTVYRSVIVIPDLFDVQSLWARTTDLGGTLGVTLNQQLADPFARRTKRLFDLLAVTLSLPLWVPLCLLIGLTIWLEDRSTPIFLQSRLGLGGRTFQTWKFRTMVPNGEVVLREYLARDPALQAEWDANHKLRHDPRITRVGAFLRKTSLDELPQLVNVLLGDMALVGPRPLPGYHYERLPLNVQQLRREVRPGMTGLWQVSGRSDAGDEGMIIHDPYYVRNWSVWLDLVILLRTFRAVVRSAGAY